MNARRHPMAAAVLPALTIASIQLGDVSSAHAQDVIGCKVDDEDRHRLLVIDDAENLEPHLLRRFDGKVVDSMPSPNGKYIGALVSDPDSDQDGLWTFTLHVLNQKGRTLTTVKNAQGFAFSPDERYVAVTTGQPFEGASGFVPEATRVIDLSSRRLRRYRSWEIPELKDATEVDWTTLPGEGLTLMAKKPLGKQKIWKYLVKQRRARGTDWKGLHFSPDGKYYYMTPREAIEEGMCEPGNEDDSCLRAFTSQNKELRLRLKKRFRRALGWTGNNGHELLITEGTGKAEEEMEIDLESGRMRVLEERLNKRWRVRRGAHFIDDETRGRMKLKADRLFEELEQMRKRSE